MTFVSRPAVELCPTAKTRRSGRLCHTGVTGRRFVYGTGCYAPMDRAKEITLQSRGARSAALQHALLGALLPSAA